MQALVWWRTWVVLFRLNTGEGVLGIAQVIALRVLDTCSNEDI